MPQCARGNADSPSAATDWSEVADTLVRDGVTTKSITEVAEALQLWEVGTPPNTIARRLGLHRDTVTKITTAAEDLMSAAKICAREVDCADPAMNLAAAPMPSHAHAKFADALRRSARPEARELQLYRVKPASTPQI